MCAAEVEPLPHKAPEQQVRLVDRAAGAHHALHLCDESNQAQQRVGSSLCVAYAA